MKTYLHLENGERFEGLSFGAGGASDGEVVFTTGMTGYPESLTDPSFAGQILVFTYPLIGNYGVPTLRYFQDDIVSNFESGRIWVNGVVVGDVCDSPSHHTSSLSLSAWLAASHIPGITHIDTRALTLVLRTHGVMGGIISPLPVVSFPKKKPAFLIPDVSSPKPVVYTPKGTIRKRITLIDCGVKHGILRALLRRGYQVTRIPWDADPLDFGPTDGVFVSNGPGDPKDCGKTVAAVRRVLGKNIPYLGVCLGHQILSLAIGADTYKLPFGHRGLNQPCRDSDTGKSYVTSQNHGYAVRASTIPRGFTPWFTNLNDGTNEGLHHRTKNIRSVQFHPEGNPGPVDTDWVFDALL